MRAAVYDRYGSPDVLRVEEVPTPSPAAGQVLVRVAATSINLSDWECLRGSPLYARIGGLRAPARRTLGSDIAGWVEASATASPGSGTGDAGVRRQPRAQGRLRRVRGRARSRARAQAAGADVRGGVDDPPSGGDRAARNRRRGGRHRVLVNGAGGGTGSFAIQLAKRLGAHVTGVDNAGKLDFMRSLGADEVIDYRSEDFTRSDEPYDLILDLVAHRSVFAYRRALAPGGRYRCVGGPVSERCCAS